MSSQHTVHLASSPPLNVVSTGSDRVGVLRTLQMDVTLCRGEDGVGWRLSLSEPGQHKTSQIFGCASTTLNAKCAEWIDRYLEFACIPSGGYLFHKRDDWTEPFPPSDWTRLIQGIFATHSGVKLCPKDLRTHARVVCFGTCCIAFAFPVSSGSDVPCKRCQSLTHIHACIRVRSRRRIVYHLSTERRSR